MGIDDLGHAATPQKEELPLSQRSIAWWLFYMPGKVILWFGYMFPTSIVGSFAGARQRNVPLIQLGYSLVFYVVVAFIGLAFAVMYHNGKPDEVPSASRTVVMSSSNTDASSENQAAKRQEPKAEIQLPMQQETTVSIQPGKTDAPTPEQHNKEVLQQPQIRAVAERLGVQDSFFDMPPAKQIQSIRKSQETTAKQLEVAQFRLDNFIKGGHRGTEQMTSETAAYVAQLKGWQGDLAAFANALEGKNQVQGDLMSAAQVPEARPFGGIGEYKYENPGCCSGALELTAGAQGTFNLFINTVTNEDQRVCNIEQENVKLARSGIDSGTIDFLSADAACRIHIAIRGRMISVSATGDECSMLCGAGAQFEGNYLK